MHTHAHTHAYVPIVFNKGEITDSGEGALVSFSSIYFFMISEKLENK